MSFAKAKSTDQVAASLVSNAKPTESVRGGGLFHVQCFDAAGELKWESVSHNLVVNEGLQNMNDRYFAGVSYTAALYVGLITGPSGSTTYIATDTLAIHAGWTEFTNYSGSRKLVTFGAATSADPSVITNSASPSSFSITGAGGTVAGAFLCTVASGTSGVLFSESDFQAPGDRTVIAGDTLNVTYTFSLDAL